MLGKSLALTSIFIGTWFPDTLLSQTNSRQGFRAVNIQQFVQDYKLNVFNPNQVAGGIFNRLEESEGRRSNQIEVRFIDSDNALLMVTLDGLADDSVRAKRHRIEMQRTGDRPWRIVWIGQQVKCWAGRGSQTWTDKNCV